METMNQFRTIKKRHDPIGDDDVEMPFMDFLQRVKTIGDLDDGISGVLKQNAHQRSGIVIVIHDENSLAIAIHDNLPF